MIDESVQMMFVASFIEGHRQVHDIVVVQLHINHFMANGEPDARDLSMHSTHTERGSVGKG